MKSRRWIIYSLKIPGHRAKFEDRRFILFPISESTAPITRLSNRLVEELEAPGVSIKYRSLVYVLASVIHYLICYAPHTDIEVYGSGNSRYLQLSEGSMPTTIRVRYGMLEFSVGQTLMTPPIHVVVNHRRNIYIHTSAHMHVILLRTYRMHLRSRFHLPPSSVYDKCKNIEMTSNCVY